MSYRAAWGKIKKTEEILGFKLVERSANRKEGYQLTEAGRELRERFDQWMKEVRSEAMKRGRALFGEQSIAALKCKANKNAAKSGRTVKKRQSRRSQELQELQEQERIMPR